jgi:hypothetical protein
VSSDQGICLTLANELPVTIGGKSTLQTLPQHLMREYFLTGIKDRLNRYRVHACRQLHVTVGEAVGTPSQDER